MAKLVTTQYRENYGSHDWNGKGDCPQYWKSKGGEVYIVDDSIDIKIFEDTIAYSDNYSEESVVNIIECSEDEADSKLDPWEIRTYVSRYENGMFKMSEVIDNEESKCYKKEVLKVDKNYILYKDLLNERKKKPIMTVYVMEDGQRVYNRDGLMDWYKNL
tara:strand:- start:114 stop:593 length:480 start_codon:yes stop_codon:yes gene_type:complete